MFRYPNFRNGNNPGGQVTAVGLAERLDDGEVFQPVHLCATQRLRHEQMEKPVVCDFVRKLRRQLPIPIDAICFGSDFREKISDTSEVRAVLVSFNCHSTSFNGGRYLPPTDTEAILFTCLEASGADKGPDASWILPGFWR